MAQCQLVILWMQLINLCHIKLFSHSDSLFNWTRHVTVQGLEYRWVQTGKLVADGPITALSWNLEGTRLLTGGKILQLWHQASLYQDDSQRKIIPIYLSSRNSKTLVSSNVIIAHVPSSLSLNLISWFQTLRSWIFSDVTASYLQFSLLMRQSNDLNAAKLTAQ